MRFLANAHPRIEQRVHQILTAMLLVAADRGVALVPASATSLQRRGRRLQGARPRRRRHPARRDPERPVELHAIWVRGRPTPVAAAGSLDVIADVVDVASRRAARVMLCEHHWIQIRAWTGIVARS